MTLFLKSDKGRRGHGSRFHFEQLWARDGECPMVIEKAWKGGSFDGSVNSLSSGFKLCARALPTWSSLKFGHIPKKVNTIQGRLEKLYNEPRTGGSMSQIREAEKELDKVLNWEEEYWRQRSRAEWLKSGDRNTKYFHSKASARWSKNEIIGLEDNEGHWRESEEEIKEVVQRYFSDIYSTSHPNVEELEEVLGCIVEKVLMPMKEALMAPFSEDDIRHTKRFCAKKVNLRLRRHCCF